MQISVKVRAGVVLEASFKTHRSPAIGVAGLSGFNRILQHAHGDGEGKDDRGSNGADTAIRFGGAWRIAVGERALPSDGGLGVAKGNGVLQGGLPPGKSSPHTAMGVLNSSQDSVYHSRNCHSVWPSRS